jgi:hypothetical protein
MKTKSYNLLSVGTNSKIKKAGTNDEYIVAGLSLMPSDYVKGINLCAMAKLAGCRETCLVWAGRGNFKPVIDARTRKTVLYRDNKAGFMAMLRGDIYAFIEDCRRFNLKPAIRLNVISDINFLSIIEDFPEVQFYDYTKVLSKHKKVMPKNYHLTFSYSEANKKYVDLFKPIWKTSYNVAVVFKCKTLPNTFKGRRVINGDLTDHRFLDPQGVVVGLTAKGKARQDTSGFAIDLLTI